MFVSYKTNKWLCLKYWMVYVSTIALYVVIYKGISMYIIDLDFVYLKTNFIIDLLMGEDALYEKLSYYQRIYLIVAIYPGYALCGLVLMIVPFVIGIIFIKNILQRKWLMLIRMVISLLNLFFMHFYLITIFSFIGITFPSNFLYLIMYGLVINVLDKEVMWWFDLLPRGASYLNMWNYPNIVYVIILMSKVLRKSKRTEKLDIILGEIYAKYK